VPRKAEYQESWRLGSVNAGYQVTSNAELTILGRTCASFIMLLGIGLVTLPAGLLESAMLSGPVETG
jgi:hypothetical protein